MILTDLQHAWAANPLHPVYGLAGRDDEAPPPPSAWIAFDGGVVPIGHDGDGFAFDNESPRHRVYLQGYRLANRLVTNEEFLAFRRRRRLRPARLVAFGRLGRTPGSGLGRAALLATGRRDMVHHDAGAGCGRSTCGRRSAMSAITRRTPTPAGPARLPTEAEWETAAATQPVTGHFQEGDLFRPAVAPAPDDCGPLYQLYGDVWQWTASPYVGYPGYRPAAGALGEYNGKFMCNQMVLRGASCATPRSHARQTYRNFFPPDARWQFAGIRLAQES